MSIHAQPSAVAKYFVIVFNGKNIPPTLAKINPTICSFYGSGFFSTTKRDAYDLAKNLSKIHPNRIYMVQSLDFLENTTFGE